MALRYKLKIRRHLVVEECLPGLVTLGLLGGHRDVDRDREGGAILVNLLTFMFEWWRIICSKKLFSNLQQQRTCLHRNRICNLKEVYVSIFNFHV